MRLGGTLVEEYSSPKEWADLVREMGYSAVQSPINCTADESTRRAYLACAKENDWLIGEVGVWKNCLSPDDVERKAAMEYAKAQLQLAEELGANCCVNIIGSRGKIWDGFHEDNYAPDVYEMAVDSVREIIDAVKPKHTFYTIESMPWMVPDSPEQYLQLIKDVDREAFGVHLDFVNMINCPKRYVKSTDFVKHCFELLGPHIKSIHVKDAIMEKEYTTVIHEVMPGKGTLNYLEILPLIEKLGPNTPAFVEHFNDTASYKQATAYLRECGQKAGIFIK